MEKVQRLHLSFNKEGKLQQPIFNPLTGEKLVNEAPFKESDLPYSDSVLLTYAAEFFSDGPIYCHADLNEADFTELEDEEALANKLNELKDEHNYIILFVEHYENNPHDYSGVVYVLRIQNAFVQP